MDDIQTSKTLENLRMLFARDSETLLRYRCFSVMARNDGADAAGDLFDRLAEGQLQLAEGHLDLLRDVGDPFSGLPLRQSREILYAALVSERHELRDLLPVVASMAETEGLASVASWVRSVGHLKAANIERLETLLDDAAGRAAAEA